MASEARSTEESGLMAREDFGDVPRSNFVKISLEDFVRCVPAVVQGRSTCMAATNGMPIRKGTRRRAFSVTSVVLAA